MSLELAKIVVMAKLPKLGRVKTRLCPPFSPNEAAALHDLFVRETLIRLGEIGSEVGRILCFTPSQAEEEVKRLYTDTSDCVFLPQVNGHLGDRLVAAARVVAKRGPVLFLGADTPHLPRTQVEQVVAALVDGVNVIGPSDDGGFWCLGLQSGVDPAPLFVDVEWSSGRECDQVQGNAGQAGIELVEASLFFDVDRPEDLARLWTGLKSSNAPADRRLGTGLVRLIGRERLEQIARATMDPR